MSMEFTYQTTQGGKDIYRTGYKTAMSPIFAHPIKRGWRAWYACWKALRPYVEAPTLDELAAKLKSLGYETE